MAKTSLKKVSSMMKGIDLCMLTTVNGRGAPLSRPMSNNGQVDYDGTSYFFTDKKSLMFRELKKNPSVGLSFIHPKFFGKTYISVSGKANLSTDKLEMEKHWSPDLEVWFKDGLDTKGIVMIEVQAKHIKYWDGGEQGEVDIKK
ncbi:MAG: pyridoxamine 5'-phosphate oxidase family protein [Rhizobacter sp.]|nr:pyridoxamine 5'-phosphate oxidase family protein [Bacteriovorax sp.]